MLLELLSASNLDATVLTPTVPGLSADALLVKSVHAMLLPQRLHFLLPFLRPGPPHHRLPSRHQQRAPFPHPWLPMISRMVMH